MTMLPRNSCASASPLRKIRAPHDDHDLVRRIYGTLTARLWLFAFSPDEDAIALVLDLQNGERGKRRRARSFPGAQIETGVVPGQRMCCGRPRAPPRAVRDNGCNAPHGENLGPERTNRTS